MTESSAPWNVLPYDPIDRLEPNLWVVDGDLEGMALRRRMTVIKRSDGKLVIHNAIAMHEDDMKELEEWGEPAYLIVPNGWHRLDAPAYKERYPDIKVYCPTGARERVAQRVHVDGTLEDFPQDQRVEVETLDGLKASEGVVKVYSGPGKERTTLIFNDAIFNQPHIPGFQGFVMKLMGSTGGPKVTRIMRWFVIKDKRAFKSHLLRLSETPQLHRIIVSHGHIIDEHAPGTLRNIANAL